MPPPVLELTNPAVAETICVPLLVTEIALTPEAEIPFTPDDEIPDGSCARDSVWFCAPQYPIAVAAHPLPLVLMRLADPFAP